MSAAPYCSTLCNALARCAFLELKLRPLGTIDVSPRRQLHRIGFDRQSACRAADAASGVAIGFWDYFRVGAPLTIITLAIGTLWLWL
jgi:hypothetical protein